MTKIQSSLCFPQESKSQHQSRAQINVLHDRFQLSKIRICFLLPLLPSHVLTFKSNGASCYQDPQIPCAQCYIKHSCWSPHANVHTTNHIYFWIPQLTSGRSISYAQPVLKSMEIPSAAGQGVFGWARVGYFRNGPPTQAPADHSYQLHVSKLSTPRTGWYSKNGAIFAPHAETRSVCMRGGGVGGRRDYYVNLLRVKLGQARFRFNSLYAEWQTRRLQ